MLGQQQSRPLLGGLCIMKTDHSSVTINWYVVSFGVGLILLALALTEVEKVVQVAIFFSCQRR